MKLRVDRAALQRELVIGNSIVSRNPSVPVLGSVLLNAKGSQLEMTSTDLDVTLVTQLGAHVDMGGSCVVPAKKLEAIVKALPDDEEVSISQGKRDTIRIQSGRSRFKLLSLDKENFVETPQGTTADVWTLDMNRFREAIKLTAFAITKEQGRYHLNGAQLTLNSGDGSMVATDGHRLAVVTMPKAGDKELSVLVPEKVFGVLPKMSGDTCEIKESENHVFFHLGGRVLISRKLTGSFPNWEMVIPNDNHRLVTVAPVTLASALERVSVLADDQSNMVQLHLSPKQIAIASDGDQGEAKDRVPCKYDGDSMSIGFNARYLIEYLSRIPDAEVSLEFENPDSQLLMTSKETGSRYVVMPMKI